jgi:hypothetical protein
MLPLPFFSGAGRRKEHFAISIAQQKIEVLTIATPPNVSQQSIRKVVKATLRKPWKRTLARPFKAGLLSS